MKEYLFEIQTLISIKLKSENKELARDRVMNDLERGDYDEELRKFAMVTKGREVRNIGDKRK